MIIKTTAASVEYKMKQYLAGVPEDRAHDARILMARCFVESANYFGQRIDAKLVRIKNPIMYVLCAISEQPKHDAVYDVRWNNEKINAELDRYRRLGNATGDLSNVIHKEINALGIKNDEDTRILGITAIGLGNKYVTTNCYPIIRQEEDSYWAELMRFADTKEVNAMLKKFVN